MECLLCCIVSWWTCLIMEFLLCCSVSCGLVYGIFALLYSVGRLDMETLLCCIIGW